MNKDTLTKMQHMKLYGMHHAFKDVVERHTAPGLSADQLVGHLVDAEYDDRYNRKIVRLQKNAHLATVFFFCRDLSYFIVCL